MQVSNAEVRGDTSFDSDYDSSSMSEYNFEDYEIFTIEKKRTRNKTEFISEDKTLSAELKFEGRSFYKSKTVGP